MKKFFKLLAENKMGVVVVLVMILIAAATVILFSRF
jgi:hypothetical protein